MPVCGTSAPLYATQLSQVSVIPVTVAVIAGPAIVSIGSCLHANLLAKTFSDLKWSCEANRVER